MLHYKDIAKLDEIKSKFNNVWLSSEYLRAHLNILGFNKIKNNFTWCKKAGYSFQDLISTLLILPIIGVENIYGLSKTTDNGISKRGKDAYYRILANQKINWRAF